MTDFPIEMLRSVDFHVPDVDRAVDFYTRVWGLDLADRSGGSAWLRATGSDCHVLALHGGDAACRSTTYRAAPAADLEALAWHMAAATGSTARAIGPINDHGGGIGFAARDRVGRTVRVVQHDDRATPLPGDQGRPERLAHVNINSDDVARDIGFYVEGMGFKLTDRSKMMGFVRTNSDHHTVVIADAPVNTLNHVAFLLPSWEGVMIASGRMVDRGDPIGWGPGRHGPGDNVFAYFVSPDGFVVEHTAEVLQVDDGYRVGGPEDWTWPPGRTDQWGICPPKTGACKAAQLAIPFADTHAGDN
ncbi:VOC family protein [Sphingomonas sp. LB3N6]|uniref:VOC family protein n=1 Tax=Sphingomonas fucosidasi TaxID=3096164 RepID=UPI002FC649DA